MIKTLLIGLLAFYVVEAKGIEVSEFVWDFGAIPTNAYAHHTFILKNIRSIPIKIKKIRRFCGCLIFSLSDTILYPDVLTYLNVGYFSGTKSTNEKNKIYITTDDQEDMVLKFTVTAEVGKEITGIQVEPKRLKVFDLKKTSLKFYNASDHPAPLKVIYATKGIEVDPETTTINPRENIKISITSKYKVFDEKPSILFEIKGSRITIPIDLK